jgi:Dolichyl-phosphate-mannose-protein mannosyltransferase
MKIRFKGIPWFIWTILALCVGFFIFEITQIVQYAFQPNQMDFGEGFTMYIAKLWANGQFQWNPSHQPYMTLIYGVVYPIILKPFVLLFGPDLRIGRIYCLIATVIIAIFIFLIARRFSKNKIICAIAALLPMLHPAYRQWIMQARCDMVAIMFSVIGVYIAIRWQSDKRIFWSIPLFLLAVFTKQTAIIGAGAVCLYLLITNRKTFLIYTGIFLVSLAAIILAGNALTDGQFFKQLWDYDQTVPFTWSLNFVALNNKAIFYPLMIILPFIAIILLRKPNLYKQYLIPLLWLLISIIITCVLLYRKGGFVNYGMELIIISALCFALLLEHVNNIHFKKFHIIIICLLIPLQILLSFSVKPLRMPDKDYATAIAAVKEIIKNTNEPILTENAGLVLSAGKTPYYEPFVYTNLEQLGYFDQNIVINDLNNQRMDYLVLERPESPGNYDSTRFTPQIVAAIDSNYRIEYTFFNFSWGSLFCVYESNSLYQEQHKTN